MTNIKRGVYQHYKNKKYYRVLGVAKHTETEEDLVLYRALYENPWAEYCVRPVKMFLEEVEHEGTRTQRFKYVGEEIPNTKK